MGPEDEVQQILAEQRRHREGDSVEGYMEEPSRRTATPESAGDGRCTSWRSARVSRGRTTDDVARGQGQRREGRSSGGVRKHQTGSAMAGAAAGGRKIMGEQRGTRGGVGVCVRVRRERGVKGRGRLGRVDPTKPSTSGPAH
jgi:hypothetical protein